MICFTFSSAIIRHDINIFPNIQSTLYSLNEYHLLIVYLFHEVMDCLLIFYLVFLYQHSSVITVCTFILFCTVSGLSINVACTFFKNEWGKTVWKFFKNFNRITIWPSNSTSEYISKKKKKKKERKNESWNKNRYLHTHVHSSNILNTKSWKPTTDEWINQMWCIHTMKYYSALKRNGILAHAIVYTNLKDIMLSEISQTQKDKYCTIPLTWGT